MIFDVWERGPSLPPAIPGFTFPLGLCLADVPKSGAGISSCFQELSKVICSFHCISELEHSFCLLQINHFTQIEFSRNSHEYNPTNPILFRDFIRIFHFISSYMKSLYIYIIILFILLFVFKFLIEWGGGDFSKDHPLEFYLDPRKAISIIQLVPMGVLTPGSRHI